MVWSSSGRSWSVRTSLTRSVVWRMPSMTAAKPTGPAGSSNRSPLTLKLRVAEVDSASFFTRVAKLW
ncbi:hypothetical protein D3C71_754460 [compost metagenome]